MGGRQPQRCRWLGLRIPVLTMTVTVTAIIGGATRHSDYSGNIGGHEKEGTQYGGQVRKHKIVQLCMYCVVALLTLSSLLL